MTSYGGLIAQRLLLGAFEACLFPSLTICASHLVSLLYSESHHRADLTMFYKRTEIAVRIAYLFVASAISSAFGSLLAAALLSIHADGRPTWFWLYLIEGIIPIACAFIVYVMLPSNPEQRHFLFTRAEREVAIKRSRAAHNAADAKVRWKLLYTPLIEIRFWLIVVIGSCNHFGVGTLQYFIPSILLVSTILMHSMRY